VAGLVVGIFHNSDAKALESALSAQQLDLSKIKVLACDGDNAEGSALHFVDVVRDVESDNLDDDMTEGTGVMQDFGTGVPGLGSHESHPRLDVFAHHGGTTQHYLAGFPVPDDEVENFDDAVADGRAVVLYPEAGPDEPKVAAAFRAAGLQNVRSY
jgi:hypothetical protein